MHSLGAWVLWLYFCMLQERPPCIPESVRRKREAMETNQKRKLERDIELEEGDDYILDLRSKAMG